MTKLQLQRYDIYGYDYECQSDDHGDWYKVHEVDAVLKEQADEVFYWKNIAKSALDEKKSKLEQIEQLQARINELETLLCTATNYDPEKHLVAAHNHYQRMYEIKKRKIIADGIKNFLAPYLYKGGYYRLHESDLEADLEVMLQDKLKGE